MGSFSYTCHLSGLPITSGQPAVLLPLFPKEKWSYNNSQESLAKYGKGNLCSNDGANMFFDELFFPIFGEYDEYGGLENIEKDDNTAVLEAFFGLTIQQIANVITDCRRDEFEKGSEYTQATGILDKNNENHMMLLKTSSTWYHRGFYDKISTIDSKEYFDRLDLGTHGILVALGFTEVGTDKSQERYKKLYEKDGLQIHSDGTWINIPKEQIYSVFDLKNYCAKNNVVIDEKSIAGGLYSQIYDFKLSYDASIIDFSKDREAIHMLLGDEYKISGHTWEFYQSLIDKQIIKKDKVAEIRAEQEKTINKNITLFYFKSIKENGNNFLKKNIVDWFNVKQYYYSTGRYLYPIGTSPQEGGHTQVKIMLSTALEVLTEEMKKRGEDMDDEDEE